MATDPSPVTEEAIDAALAADAEWMARTRQVVFVSPSRAQVRVMLEAASPLLTGPAEARLAEVRETATTFLAEYGDSGAPIFRVAGDLARAVLQVIDRDRTSSEEQGDG